MNRDALTELVDRILGRQCHLLWVITESAACDPARAAWARAAIVARLLVTPGHHRTALDAGRLMGWASTLEQLHRLASVDPCIVAVDLDRMGPHRDQAVAVLRGLWATGACTLVVFDSPDHGAELPGHLGADVLVPDPPVHLTPLDAVA